MEPRSTRRPLLTPVPTAPAGVSPPPAARRPRHRSRPAIRCGTAAAVVLLTALTAVGGWPLEAAQTLAADSVCDDAPHHRLDFLLGDWRVVGPGDEPIAISRIERIHGGCAVRESWITVGGDATGEGLSYVDPADHVWKQLWVDSTGIVTRAAEASGARDLPPGALRFAGESTFLDGTSVLYRLTARPLDGGRLHVVIEHSRDDGATWQSVFDVQYVPQAVAPTPRPEPAPDTASGRTAEPSPAPTPTPTPTPGPPTPPAPEPAPAPQPSQSSGGVRASSGVVPEKDVPLEERNRIFLESPMILELPIGPIESIPEEYSWSSKETSVYVSGGVSVRRVTLSRDEHGKKVDVDATAALYSTGYLDHVDLTVELVWRGDVLATASEDKVSIGRSVLSQSDGDGLEKRFTLTVDRSRFEEAFGDADERPVLRLTVTVRD